MEKTSQNGHTRGMSATPAANRTTFRRIVERLQRHSVWEHLLGLWIGRKITKHGILAVVPGLPLPKVLNRGGKIVIENIQLYPGVRLEVGREGVIRIGKGTYLNRNTVVVADTLVDIGRNCRISWDVVIMDTDQHKIVESVPMSKPIIIEENVWIGCRCIILKGVRIGSGAIIAAGAVVTKDIPPLTVAGGVPARVLYELNTTG
jgi:acetyltransferase-like isoleucine patch superfamily enzyme